MPLVSILTITIHQRLLLKILRGIFALMFWITKYEFIQKKYIEISNRPKGLVDETLMLPRGWFHCGTLDLI